MRLLITGVTGLLGANLAWEAQQAGFAVWGVAARRPLPGAPFPMRTVDLTAPAALDAVWAWARPDAVIHTAALAHVDACERDPARAREVNAVLPGALAARAAQAGVPLVHISTDAVFDGPGVGAAWPSGSWTTCRPGAPCAGSPMCGFAPCWPTTWPRCCWPCWPAG